MTLPGFALAYAGFLALSLAMERHHEQLLGTRRIPPLRRRLCGIAGWLLLGASAVALVNALGWGFGLVLWAGALHAAALTVALLLTYAPRLSLALGGLALLSSPLMVLLTG
ncbi:DUF3325 domain-containing protein [Pseudoroseomonas globiformis]|uniref:DUF3325 domain-containing protein n=1 Tax=Teichococcus globiformis TaxID=2307229 RepID=A0ABV7FYA9_9PROT